MMRFLAKYRLNKIFFILLILYLATLLNVYFSNALVHSVGSFPIEFFKNVIACIIISLYMCPIMLLYRLASLLFTPVDNFLLIWLNEHIVLNVLSLAVLIICYIWMLKSWTEVSKIVALVTTCIFLSQIFW